MIVTISEARLNDLCYLALKYFWFDPVMACNPRGCDIRVCMDVSVPSRIKSPAQAIMRSGEVAPSSHTLMHEVDTDRVMEECVRYLEDHWRVVFTADNLQEMQEWWNTTVPQVLGLLESDCGITMTARNDAKHN